MVVVGLPCIQPWCMAVPRSHRALLPHLRSAARRIEGYWLHYGARNKSKKGGPSLLEPLMPRIEALSRAHRGPEATAAALTDDGVHEKEEEAFGFGFGLVLGFGFWQQRWVFGGDRVHLPLLLRVHIRPAS